MNITEKQKQIMINFMRSHADFGRGRLRYNRENKKKLVSISTTKDLKRNKVFKLPCNI